MIQVGEKVIIRNWGTYDQATVTRIGKTFSVKTTWDRRDRLDASDMRPFDAGVWAEIKRLGQEIATARDQLRELEERRRRVFEAKGES